MKAFFDIPDFEVMKVVRLAAERERKGKSIVHLEVGQPVASLPGSVLHSLQTHLSEPMLYTEAVGTRELRTEIARTYNEDPERVAVAAGTSVLIWALASLLGDTDAMVASPSPYYPAHVHFFRATGADIQLANGRTEAEVVNSLCDLAKNSDSQKSIAILSSPGNPTGFVYTSADLDRLSQVFDWVILDEIYNGTQFDSDKQGSLYRGQKNVIVLDGISKRYACTGWRIGWALIPTELQTALVPILQNGTICAPSLSQKLTKTLLQSSDARKEAELRHRLFAQNSELAQGVLESLGWELYGQAKGAFYLLAKPRNLSMTGLELASALLDRGVAVTPGIDFGPEASDYIRITTCVPTPELEKGLHILRTFQTEAN